jgi:WD40 repeat protein
VIISTRQPITCLGISDDDSQLVGAVASWDLNVMLRWTLKEPKRKSSMAKKKFGMFGDEVVDLSQQFNLERLVAAAEGEEGETAVNHNEEFQEFENGHTDNIGCCLMLRDGTNRVVTGSYDRRVKFFDVSTGELVMACRGHPVGHHHWVTGIDVTANFAISGSRDKTIKVWDKVQGDILHTINIGKKVGCVAMAPSERWFVCGVGKELHLYSWLPAGAEGPKSRSAIHYHHAWPHSELVHTCSFYNEERILSVSRDEICVWCKEYKHCILRHPSKSEPITCCTATPNAQVT